jgi:hypothetical protein
VQHLGRQHRGKDGPRHEHSRARSDTYDTERGNNSLRPRGVNERPAWYLTRERNNAADRQDKPNVGLRPFMHRQEDGDKRAKSGLHIGEEEDEPIETAQAPGGGRGARGDRYEGPTPV